MIVGEYLAAVTNKLNISERALASLLNMDAHTLGHNNRSKTIGDLTPKTRKKLGVLFHLVLEEFAMTDPAYVIEIFNEHVFENVDGFKESVISAIESNDYDIETVLDIGRMAFKQYEEKIRKGMPELPHVVSA